MKNLLRLSAEPTSSKLPSLKLESSKPARGDDETPSFAKLLDDFVQKGKVSRGRPGSVPARVSSKLATLAIEATREELVREVVPTLVAQLIAFVAQPVAPAVPSTSSQSTSRPANDATPSDDNQKIFPGSFQNDGHEEGFSDLQASEGRVAESTANDPDATSRDESTPLKSGRELPKVPERLAERPIMSSEPTPLGEHLRPPPDAPRVVANERQQRLARAMQNYVPRDLFRLERTERGGRASLKLEVAEHQHVGFRLEVEDGVVRVVMVAHSNEARAWLQKSADQLVAALVATGLRLDDVEVDLGSHDDPDDPRRKTSTDGLFESSETEGSAQAVWLDALPTKISIVT